MFRTLADVLTEATLKLWRSLLAPLSQTGTAHESLVLVQADSKVRLARIRANAARSGRF
jgi:hypothetical protein